MNLAHRKNFRAVKMRPADLEPALPSVLAALKPSDELQFARRYTHLPLVCVIVDPSGLPVAGPSLFLAACAIKSRGVTGDTPSTYGDCVLDWIRYLDAHGKTLASATEETLQLYRSSGFRAKGVTSATANLRIAVVVQLHTWSQRNGFPSPLGRYLLERDRNDRSLAPRVIGRHPRVMSVEELQRIFGLTTLVFRLAFRWCVTAGLRRFEVAGLTSDLLPPPESLPFCEDGIVKFDLLRKGGKQVPIYAPLGLVEETQWFIITDRMESQPGYENHIFINQRGFPLSRQSLSKEFRRCANLIGSDATLHHLRHTFAVNLLKLVEAFAKKTPEINALKIVQVLMGHSSSATTETYLRAMEVSSAAVRDALDYLYGATL